MSDRRSSQRKRRPDPHAAFSYEMERAESTRRAALAAGAALTVFVVVVIAVVAAAVAGARPNAEETPAVAVAIPSETASTVASDAVEIAAAEAAENAEAAAAELLAEAEPEPEAKPPVVKPVAPKPAPKAPAGSQRFSIAIGDVGYKPAAISAKAGVPIVLSVAQGEGCAAGFLMPELGLALDNSTGPITAELGALEPGEYRFTCGMDMVSGLLMVR